MKTTVQDLGEFGLIERIRQMLHTSPAVVEGVGDDCAVLRICERLMLVSCDLFIENVHFRRDFASADEIGWKAGASSLSDVAAMGGQPMFALISLACPPETKANYVQMLYRGLSAVLSRFGTVIVGGDTSVNKDALVLDVTVLGRGIGNRCLTRKGVRPGDVLAVTGSLGRAAAGLHAIENGHDAPDLRRAHTTPRPRVPEGQWLCSQPCAHAMIDISDGLAQDAGHMADASRLGVDIDPEKVVVAPELGDYCNAHGLNPLDFVLNGGEDYELAFAIDGEYAHKALDAFRNEFRTEVTIIGAFTTEWTGVRVCGDELSSTGYNHFRQPAEVEEEPQA